MAAAVAVAMAGWGRCFLASRTVQRCTPTAAKESEAGRDVDIRERL